MASTTAAAAELEANPAAARDRLQTKGSEAEKGASAKTTFAPRPPRHVEEEGGEKEEDGNDEEVPASSEGPPPERGAGLAVVGERQNLVHR